ncbi:Restriction endonuclease [Zobellia roscoffensis]|uniref:hypothetical protein n=1 Tax=Zobellia roscoffensis TaxID=2779508 RepID=UPI00188C3956|nr:hypothetical protein [Zobellia roscoffensis]
MTEIQFFQKIHKKYKESNLLIEGDGGFKIKRGMAHVMSGYLEDLFALFIAKKINNPELEFFVDKVTSIRFEINEKAKSFKPDLMIIENNVMTHYFDLKTNLGWNRNAENYLINKNELIKKLKGRNAWIRDKQDKTIKDIKIAEDLKYHMVIVFGGNINPAMMSNNFKVSRELENVQLDVLHNQRKDESIGSINLEAFNNIYNSILIQD